MGFKFTKMHGLGNDFMVVDAIHQSIDLTPATIAALSRRDTGVGFDQCQWSGGWAMRQWGAMPCTFCKEVWVN